MHFPAMRLHHACVGILLCLTQFANAHAATYIPKYGAQVLEYLPSRNDPGQCELASLRAQSQQEPANVGLATARARRYVQLARNFADPRYLGYALGC